MSWVATFDQPTTDETQEQPSGEKTSWAKKPNEWWI